MAEDREVESLLAAIGMDAILSARPSLHKYQLQEAANLPKEMRRRVLAFIASDTFDPANDLPKFDYDKVSSLVKAEKLDDRQATALHAAVPDRQLAHDIGLRAELILSWAKKALPRDMEPTPIGVRPAEPSPSALADFRRVWQVALDPMSVLDDMDDGSLADDQVAALKELYPAIYDELKQAIFDAVATMQARRGIAWEPIGTKVAVLQMLRGEQQIDTQLAADAQMLYAQQPQPPAAAPPSRRKGSSTDEPDASTPGQKAAAS